MKCPFCNENMYELKDKSGAICKACRNITGASKISIRRNKDNNVYKFYLTLESYRLINDLEEDSFTLLQIAISNPKAAMKTYKSIYEGPATKISPFDIDALKEYVKSLLIFM